MNHKKNPKQQESEKLPEWQRIHGCAELLQLWAEVNIWMRGGGSYNAERAEKSPGWRQTVTVCLPLTLQSRCSRLWSEAHLRWSSESSSTWLSRLKCSRASFSCISRTCSSCSKEHTLPRRQKKSTNQDAGAAAKSSASEASEV